MPTGPANSLTDVPGLAVGGAQDEAARTGVTVVLPDEAAICAADLRGGGPGTRETDALRLDGLVDRADAVVLAGGSVYGLGAADAVTAALGARGRGFALLRQDGVPVSPIVPAAILYDLANGGDKAWGEEPPYRRLGREALAAAGPHVATGRAGAGYGARAGTHPGGLGTASWVMASGHTVGAVVAVNSFGSAYVPDAEGRATDRFWAAPWEAADEFGGRGVGGGGVTDLPFDTKLADAPRQNASRQNAPRQNTTIALVATDAPLTKAQCRRLAVMAQDGLARAIRPAHGPTDGDVVFAMSTASWEESRGEETGTLDLVTLGTVAGDVLARAIARGVHAAEGAVS